MKENAFCFNYSIRNLFNDESSNISCYEEYFIPYTKREILQYSLQDFIGSEVNQLFENESNFNYENEYDFLKSVDVNKVLPDTINILMDAVYCINTALLNPIIYRNLTPLQEKVHLISELTDVNKLKNFPELIFGTNINYIALYTELIKAEVNEIKYIISTLYHLYNSTEKLNKKLANNFLKKIKKIYNLKIENFEITNKNSIKEALLSFVNYRNFQNENKSFYLNIDFRNFDRFIKLLSNYKESSKFIDKDNCFCLIQEGEKYYFSFSGYKHNKCTSYYDDDDTVYDDLSKTIIKDFKLYLPSNNEVLQFCKRNDDMLSYGNEIKNDKLLKFSSPKKFGKQKNILDKEFLINQYRCCERKIFPYIKDKSESMYIYCKYEPCVRCIPAIEDMKKQYGKNFMYFAFIKNAKTFSCYLKEKKKNLPKEEDYIYTFRKLFYSFI